MAITPAEDGTLTKLLLYLRDYLNARAAEYYAGQGEPVQLAVQAVDVGYLDIAGVRQFPYLRGFRNAFTGDQFSRTQAIIDYFLLTSVQTARGQDAWFTWVVKHLAIALEEYEATIEKPCVCRLRLERAVITYSRVPAEGGKFTIPFLRMLISFDDLEIVS